MLLTVLVPFVSFLLLQIAAADQIKTCPPDQHWVKDHFRKAYLRADGTRVSAARVAPHCRTNPPGYSEWKDRLKSDRPLHWKPGREKSKKWTTEEAERALDALASLPSSLLASTVKALYRFERSSIFDQNPAASDAGIIVIYDRAFATGQNLARILAHEFAHELYRHLSDVEKNQYRLASEWMLVTGHTGERRLIPNRDHSAYVEVDGPESMTEDFSNNIEYFLFDPETLKKRTPKVYDWIKKTFGDKFEIMKGAPS